MNDFHQIVSQRSDLELYCMLHYEAEKYQEEAIAAARTEFAKRNIPQDTFETFERQIREKSQTRLYYLFSSKMKLRTRRYNPLIF